MLTGSYPFDGSDYPEILKAIIDEDKVLEFPSALSDSCKAFLNKLLASDVDQRYTAEEALDSKWILEHRYERDVAAARKSLINVLEIVHLSSSTLLTLHVMNSATISTLLSGGESEDRTHGTNNGQAMDYLILPVSPQDDASRQAQISWTPSALSVTSLGLNRLMNDIDVDEVRTFSVVHWCNG